MRTKAHPARVLRRGPRVGRRRLAGVQLAAAKIGKTTPAASTRHPADPHRDQQHGRSRPQRRRDQRITSGRWPTAHLKKRPRPTTPWRGGCRRRHRLRPASAAPRKPAGRLVTSSCEDISTGDRSGMKMNRLGLQRTPPTRPSAQRDESDASRHRARPGADGLQCRCSTASPPPNDRLRLGSPRPAPARLPQGGVAPAHVLGWPESRGRARRIDGRAHRSPSPVGYRAVRGLILALLDCHRPDGASPPPGRHRARRTTAPEDGDHSDTDCAYGGQPARLFALITRLRVGTQPSQGQRRCPPTHRPRS